MRTTLCAGILVTFSLRAQPAPRFPIPNDYTNSIKTRWLNKPVLESRLLDDAETLQSWKLVNSGQARGEISLTRERAVSGSSSLRLTSPTTGDKPIPTARYYGAAGALRVVNAQDWSQWNRLSFWIFPDLPGFRVVSLLVIFHNEGAEPVPDVYGKMGLNYVLLQNHQWNHIVWEIANLPRDRVTGIEFSYRLQGNEPGATDRVRFDIDRLELQKVEPDHYLGWNLAPGALAYNHVGYPLGGSKIAIAQQLPAAEFQLLRADTGIPVLAKPIQRVQSRIGTFQVMDFSEVRTPGVYVLRAGARTTRPFRIEIDPWKSSLWKALNFFFVERCGFAVPGVHDICHRDWLLVHGGKRIVVNGGWHDAGDLSQSLINTAEAAYAMFSLAERLQTRDEDPVLLERLLEEAKWGLDWILKTTFHDGFRPGFCMADRWTNGILGDVDDIVCQAVVSPSSSLAAAAVEALAARVLRNDDPERAAYSLQQAVEDWGFGIAALEKQTRGPMTELVGHAVVAALELWQSTQQQPYAEKAFQLAQTLLKSQQRTFLRGLNYPLTGFFYTSPDRSRILRYSHVSHEAAPVVALARLCEWFPDHPDWMQWYSAVALYSDYFQAAMAYFTQPYGMLANSLYHAEEAKQAAGGGRGANPEAFREQVLRGVSVGGDYYVRLFPVWFEFRGNHGTILTQAKALSAAAHLRRKLALADLAQAQLHWALGRNPFAQSTMWGEGYDYAPQYSAMSGDIVGSLPVGIQTRGNGDEPYWPTENCHNWKEVWVLPVSRWIWLLKDLSGPALVTGLVEAGSRAPVIFRTLDGKELAREAPEPNSGTFRAWVPEGTYEIRHLRVVRKAALLPGGSYHLDLRSTGIQAWSLEGRTTAHGRVTLTLTLDGSGRHAFSLRADNLKLGSPERTAELQPGEPKTVVWEAAMLDRDAPWVAVVIADGDTRQRVEATGSTRSAPPR